MQNAKVAEFENFLRSPYRGAVTANQTPSIFPPATQVNSSPPGGFSAFNQQPAFPNTNAGGGPPNPFGRFNQQPNAFSLNTPQPAPSGTCFFHCSDLLRLHHLKPLFANDHRSFWFPESTIIVWTWTSCSICFPTISIVQASIVWTWTGCSLWLPESASIVWTWTRTRHTSTEQQHLSFSDPDAGF